MQNPKELQDEVIRLQIRISELERENNDLRNASSVPSPTHNVSPGASMFAAPPVPPPSVPSLPPPPPMMRKAANKPLRKPRTKMRGLFWVKLRRPAGQNVQHSLWDAVQNRAPDQFLDDLLCTKLEQDYAALERKSSQRGNNTVKEPRYVEVIDSKKATNLSIQHNGLPENWFTALCEFNTSVLSEEQVQQLKSAVPSKEELNDIETAQANWPTKPLRDAEQFLVKLGSLAWIQERLTCWGFLLQAEGLVESLRYRSDLLRSAIFELRLEPNICAIVHLILTAGNFLNHGSARGDAYGFSYQLLASLADTKSNERNSNLLNFVCDQIQTRHLLSDDLGGSLDLFNGAGKFLLTELENNMTELLKEHQTCIRMIDHIASRDPEDPLIIQLHPRLASYGETLALLSADIGACREDFNELLVWLGVGVAEISVVSSVDFFQLWAKFFSAIKSASS